MPVNNRIFLTPREATAAVCADFAQYGPQKLLFLNLCPLILGKDTLVVQASHREGTWISSASRRRQFMSYAELGELLGTTLENSSLFLDVLADVCRRVFRTRVYPGMRGDGIHQGLWIETGMEAFNCRQCGRCCQTLIFHTDCTVQDYDYWESIGRTDIMERVSLTRKGGKIVSCQIWVEPGTRTYVKGCPWLRKVPDRNRYECGIHEVRPAICRQYPGTRKHAEMTGCIGFE